MDACFWVFHQENGGYFSPEMAEEILGRFESSSALMLVETSEAPPLCLLGSEQAQVCPAQSERWSFEPVWFLQCPEAAD